MRITCARLAVALLSTTALGVGAIELASDVAAHRELSRFLTAHPGLRVASIAAEPFAGRIVLRGVGADAGLEHLTIGTLQLPMARAGLGFVASAEASPFEDAPSEPTSEDAPKTAPAEPGPAEKALTGKPPGDAQAPAQPTVIAGADGAASAENVMLQSGTTTFRVKRIDFTGTKLSSTDLAALLDPKSTEPLDARLRRLNAVAIVAPEVIADDTTPGSERHATFSQVSLSGVTAGKATAGNIVGLTFTIKDGDETIAGNVGSTKAVGLDLVQLAHVFGTVRSDDAEPLKPIYDKIGAATIAIRNDKKNTQIDVASFEETQGKARALKSDTLRRANTTKLSDAERTALLDDMGHSFEIGTMEVKGLAIRNADDAGANRFSIGQLAMLGFGQGKIAGIKLSDLRFEAPKTEFAIGSGEIGPFPLPAPKGTVPSAAAMMPGLAKADFEAIDCDVTPSEKDKDTPPTRVRFTIRHTGFTSDGVSSDIPRSAKMSIDNLAFDLPPTAAGAPDPLIDMGYRHLDLTASIATAYDANAQELSIRNLTLNGADMGTLGLGLHLANVTKGIISPNKEVAKASALAVLLKGVTLDLANAGIVDRAIAWKAKQDGLTPDQERTFLEALFADKLPASVNGSANVKIVGNALAKFVAQPKSLHIAISSKDGLGIGSMGLLNNPALLIDSLDVKASANE